MSTKPIFVATHPRACSTAFERVFMTCRDTLYTVHEPFGDAWYFGPERLADRYENDPKTRKESGFENTTYRDIFEGIDRANTEGKRLFIKDMAQYWTPLLSKPASIAPSLVTYRRGVGTSTNGTSAVNGDSTANGAHLDLDVKPAPDAKEVKKDGYPYSTAAEPGNPTIVPEALLKQFHFTFLIRHPRSSIPSYYRCCVPPLQELTGFDYFDPKEAGYVELRRLFDYLRSVGQVGPKMCGREDATNGVNGHTNGDAGEKIEICLIDADDMLDDPYAMIEKYCGSIGIPYSPDMLKWNKPGDQEHAKAAFEKWKGFHEDALETEGLNPRKHAPKTEEQMMKEWTEKYGEEGAKLIKKTVDENVEHYEYLKQFAIKI